MKMTVTDQIKILDRKIMQNEAQYDLDRKAAKIFALSSNNLDKYEYLTGEDLGLQPSTVEQAKFEYSPLGRLLKNGLKEEKKEGLLKRLKNIEGKNGEQIKAIEDQGEKQLKEIKKVKTDSKSLKMVSFFNGLSPEAKQLKNKIREKENDIDPKKIVCTKSDGTIFNLNIFKLSFKFASSIYDGKITLEKAKKDQYQMFKQMEKNRKVQSKKFRQNKLQKINFN